MCASGSPSRSRSVQAASRTSPEHAAGAAWLTAEQLIKHRPLCFYCLVASAASWAAFPLALHEACAAWHRLRS